MSKTYTPELPPDVLQRLEADAARFRPDFARTRQAARAHVHPHGLLIDGARASIEPLPRRVARPAGLDVADPERALQNSVNHAARDEQAVRKRYRAVLAETFASPKGISGLDDTGFAKQGEHSVGARRPYCGAPGKRANCQVAPSIHYVSPEGHYPSAPRLDLPEVRPGDTKRRDTAGVPEAGRRPLSEGQIASELLDGVRAEGLPGRFAVADAGYGASADFRDGRRQRGWQDIVGVTDGMVASTEPATREEPEASTGGRPRERRRLAAGAPRPISLKDLAAETPREEVAWREGTEGRLSGRAARLRVRPASGRATGEGAGAEPIRLLIAEQADGELTYAVSDRPPRAGRIRAVRLRKSRRPAERGYRQLEEESGPDRFEGRSWRGFHHRACLVMPAYGFLAAERRRARRGRSRPGKEGGVGSR